MVTWNDENDPSEIVGVGDVSPRCDICGRSQQPTDDWNGETGNHRSCETYLEPFVRKEPMTKGEAAQAAGLVTYDTALPQDWLDGVVNRITGPSSGSAVNTTPKTWLAIYDIIASGTVWCYDTARMFGAPVALTDEANRLLSLLD